MNFRRTNLLHNSYCNSWFAQFLFAYYNYLKNKNRNIGFKERLNLYEWFLFEFVL